MCGGRLHPKADVDSLAKSGLILYLSNSEERSIKAPRDEQREDIESQVSLNGNRKKELLENCERKTLQRQYLKDTREATYKDG